MTRYELLINAYHHYDIIYLGMILIAAWVASTGHLLDWILQRRTQLVGYLYWGFVITAYVAGIIFIGLKF